MEEKRKALRVERTLIIQYAEITSVPLCWDSTTVKNISIDGVLFNSSKHFVQNEKLQLRILIPTDPFNRLEITGEVIGSFANKTRIKFVNLGEYEKEAISNYVNCLAKKNKQK